jgi:glucose-6-phosphate 1-dehydrogenase
VSAVIQATSVELTRITSLPQAGSALLVIFGASGDLTRRKLIPGLYDLTCVGCVPRKFEVLGVGRSPMTTEEFRARMRQGALESGGIRHLDHEQ